MTRYDLVKINKDLFTVPIVRHIYKYMTGNIPEFRLKSVMSLQELSQELMDCDVETEQSLDRLSTLPYSEFILTAALEFAGTVQIIVVHVHDENIILDNVTDIRDIVGITRNDIMKLPIYLTGCTFSEDGQLTHTSAYYSRVAYGEATSEELQPFPNAKSNCYYSARTTHSIDHYVDRVLEVGHTVSKTGRIVTYNDKESMVRSVFLVTLIKFLKLLQCKNLIVKDSNIKLPRNRKGKAIKSGLPKHLNTYKELHLDLRNKEIYRNGRKLDSISLNELESMSTVSAKRGHFKTFTKDKPLFGKHTGTYWWSPILKHKGELTYFINH